MQGDLRFSGKFLLKNQKACLSASLLTDIFGYQPPQPHFPPPPLPLS